MKREIINEIPLPEGVEANVDGSSVKMKGPKGELARTFLSKVTSIEKAEKMIVTKSKDFSKNGKRIVNTFTAHIKNMVEGVINGFTYKLKVCSGHFPMTLKLEPNRVFVNNFLGEKIPRVSKIQEGVKVKQEGDIIIVEGIDKEKVSQTAASMETATRITKRDRRRFQDGIYIIEKNGVKI